MARAVQGKQRKKLAVYRSRRDFAKTPEPSGKGSGQWRIRGNPIFVIQKHAASRLHYDFRLQVGGVLKSWAVPKGPSTNPAVKRLAVETEDHPIEYADFEGVIPQGEYGGGRVIVWDAGPYRRIRRDRAGKLMSMASAYRSGQIEVWLEGKKIHGGYALIRTGKRDDKRNWLLIKMKGEGASRGNPAVSKPRSVLSGQTIAQMGKKAKKKTAKKKVTKKKATRKKATKKTAVKKTTAR